MYSTGVLFDAPTEMMVTEMMVTEMMVAHLEARCFGRTERSTPAK
ncbi:hypothetical protein [Streptomyces sp. NPDC090798]